MTSLAIARFSVGRAFGPPLFENHNCGLAAEHGGLPVGPATNTPGDGQHHIFRQPEGQPLGNRRGALPPGIDVRGAGGWIVAPGAVRPDGRRWASSPNKPSLVEAHRAATIPQLPNWLATIIRAAPDRPLPDRL